MSKLIENSVKFTLEPKNKPGLRKCQLGAIWALKSYFITNTSEVAALLSLPTGSGKTAIMMAACFELKLSKVLIIEPSKVLRSQISEQFRSMTLLKRVGCLPEDFPDMRVAEIKHIQSADNWAEVIEKFDIIVAHPNSISPYYKNITPLQQNSIDAVFMDEAHHEAAPTWKSINTFYCNVKRIFLTATPFRRDKKTMEAKLIYHYSLKHAFNDQILRPVDFFGIQVGLNENESDSALIESALKVFKSQKAINPVSVMIRTDRIEHADRLVKLYQSAGLNVDVVHSGREDKTNSCVIDNVKSGALDGLISVGMASEGLDIPLLKIAVMHTTPKSIPYTIQFLGRISRQPKEQTGNAILIANTDEAKGEVRRLYSSDETWGKLVPQLIDDSMKKSRYYRSALIDDPDFVLPDLNIYFSALVYDVLDDFALNPNFKTKIDSDYRISYVSQDCIDSPLVVLTETDKPLEWANREIYLTNYIDAHVIYHIPDKKLLFELTTSDEALKSFSDDIYVGCKTQIEYFKLYKALSNPDIENYLMVGMKNSVMSSPSHPSYKTFIGNSVQASIRSSEGRVFGVGHALMKMGEQKTWGIATKRSRVWAMKRGTLDEYKLWCNDLAELLTNEDVTTSLPGLSFLASSSPIDEIADVPVAIIPDPILITSNIIIISIRGYAPLTNVVPNIVPQSLGKTTGDLVCELFIGSFTCQLVMNLRSRTLWRVVSEADILVRVIKDDNCAITSTLEELLNSYPPTIIMPKGYIIEGRTKITPNTSIEELPSTIWVTKDWAGCNIQSEAYKDKPAPNRLPVINKVIEYIKSDYDAYSDLVVLDDGSHEIADVIWIQGSKKIVHFIHCKPSKGKKPGCRKSDCDIVYTQAMRSVHWVYSKLIFDRINERLRGTSKIVLGSKQQLDDIAKVFGPNKWAYKIVVAQPGFDIAQVSNKHRKNNNVYELTIPTYERVTSGLASFEVWGANRSDFA